MPNKNTTACKVEIDRLSYGLTASVIVSVKGTK